MTTLGEASGVWLDECEEGVAPDRKEELRGILRFGIALRSILVEMGCDPDKDEVVIRHSHLGAVVTYTKAGAGAGDQRKPKRRRKAKA